MNNYFIAIANQDIGLQLKLGIANVEYCNLILDGISGVVMDKENLNRALKALGQEIKFETPSSLEGISLIELENTPTPSKKQVILSNWNGKKKEEFKNIAREVLLPIVDTDIEISVPHGVSVAPQNDDTFKIFFWSSPTGSQQKKPPKKIWGIPIDCDDKSFPTSGQGIAIMDPETGWNVGELVKNNLFIHHDLCHYGTSEELAIFRHLCKEVVIELTATPKEKEERQKRLAKERRQKSREQYVAECSKRFEKTVTGTQKAIENGHADIKKLQQKLTRRIRETAGAERKLKQLEYTRAGQNEAYAREFDSLLSVPGVENVEINDGVIKVFTENICITPEDHPDKTYDIGKFRMEIYVSGSNGGIRFFNLTRKGNGSRGGYNIIHPHVNKEGEPCLGNLKEMIPQLVAEYEYSAIAQVGLQFLRSVNLKDAAGREIFESWPLSKGN